MKRQDVIKYLPKKKYEDLKYIKTLEEFFEDENKDKN